MSNHVIYTSKYYSIDIPPLKNKFPITIYSEKLNKYSLIVYFVTKTISNLFKYSNFFYLLSTVQKNNVHVLIVYFSRIILIMNIIQNKCLIPES